MKTRSGALLAVLLALAARIHAQPFAELLQGTNLSFALRPNGQTFVIDLAQQLWRVPASGGGAEPLTPSGEPARNPRFSPDGALVVYQTFSGGQWDLWLLDVATSDRRALTATPDADEREPEFSADGRSVIFASNRTGHMCLWSISLEGGVTTQLTEEPGDASFPTVSELGPVAYVLDRGGQSELRALLPNGTTTALVSGTERIGAPSWRPGGGVLIFSAREGSAGSRLWMLVLGDPEVRKPLSGPEDVFRARPAWLSSSEFVYAADGQLWRRGIAAQSRRPVHVNAALAVEGRAPPSDLPQLDDPGPQSVHGFGSVAVAPDGKRAALTALGDLWLVERGSVKRLTEDPFVDLDPTFTPDGESVVFSSERSGQFELWRVPVRGGAPVQLTFGSSRATRPAVSGDGKRVAFIERDGIAASSAARVAVVDIARPAQPTVAASGLVGAERPTWGADGRTLGVRLAPTGAPKSPTASGSLPVELATAADAHPSIPDGLRPVEIKWAPFSAPEDYVVEVGRLFDGIRADYRRHVDIHVSRGRITAIVGRGVLPNPPKVIDARDATVIPGLIDVHAHESSVLGERLGRAWLAFGVTTVREISDDVPEAVERGETWASGRSPGPRLIVSAAASSTATAAAISSSAVPVRQYPGIADGFGHSLAREVRELAIPDLRAEVGRSWRGEPGSGQHYELEVSPEFASYQDTIATMVASMTTLAPGLGSVAGLRNWPDTVLPRSREPAYAALFTEAERSTWATAGPAPDAVARLSQAVVRFVRAGGRVAIGTDAPAVPYGLGVHYELALLSEAGIPNDQALRLATAGGALALGLEQQLGTLEDGKIADFVIVDGDPLERLADTLRVKAVVKGGRWFERSDLLAPPN